MKILIVLTLSFSLVFGNVISEVCEVNGSKEYFPITDGRGNAILTKKEVDRECTLTKEVQGSCIKWENKKEQFIIEADDYDAYRSRNHEGAMGSLLAMIGAYDQLEHLWSGWKGYCEIGTKTDFSWASDPMFWASLAASAIMEGSQLGDAAAAEDVAKAAAEDAAWAAVEAGGGKAAYDAAYKAAYDAAYETAMKQSAGFMADTALGKGVRYVQDGIGSMGGGMLTTWLGPKAGACMLSAGFNLSKNLYQHVLGNEKDEHCDSVDEFCGDEHEQTEESDIITIDRVDYEEIIAQDPKNAEYIIILDEQDGILTVRFKKANEMEGYSSASQKELEEMKEMMAKARMAISIAMTAYSLKSCVDGGFSGEGKAGDSIDQKAKTGADEPLLTAKSGISMAISAFPAEYLGPYGILIKAALQILVNFLFSFEDIDSCHDQDDADMQGTRHAKTCETLPHNLCHFLYEECIDNCGGAFLGLAKELVAYHYCCYDQILTKVLVVQLKAQLGRDWAHCTGITLRDLNFVSFRQCTAADKSSGIDGAKEGIADKYYNPDDTFQYKKKCIDLTEFKDYLKAQIGESIDLSDFDTIFSDVKGQAGSM